jgi:ankyrin repeat protein
MAECLLEYGASSDTEDFSGTSPLRLAIDHRHWEMAVLLFPKAKSCLSSISASDWRRCLGTNGNGHLEIVGGKAAGIAAKGDTLQQELDGMSYPLSITTTQIPCKNDDFMNHHYKEKRIL